MNLEWVTSVIIKQKILTTIFASKSDTLDNVLTV